MQLCRENDLNLNPAMCLFPAEKFDNPLFSFHSSKLKFEMSFPKTNKILIQQFMCQIKKYIIMMVDILTSIGMF